MDFEKWVGLVMKRRNKIKELSATHGIAMATLLHDTLFVDVGTNRSMLKEIGYNFDEISERNVDDLIRALTYTGLHVRITADLSAEELADRLNRIIDEEIPVIWPDGTTYEIVEIYA